MKNMSFSESDHHPDLLDLYLGQLSERQQAELRRRIDADPHLAAEDEVLAGVFRSLDQAWQPAPRAAAGLTERISARVAAAGAPLRVHKPIRRPLSVEAEESNRGGFIRLYSFRDVASVADRKSTRLNSSHHSISY